MSRRVLLGAGGAVAGLAATGTLVEHDVLPGRSRAYDVLGLTGDAGEVPDVAPGPRTEGTLDSAYVDDPSYWISYPPGSRPGDRMPVVVALHGAGRTAETWCDELSLDVFLAASGHRMAVAAVDGGLSSFWHRRDDGTDPQRMLREEFLPLLADNGLKTGRPGLLGWSMGGLGVLMLGAELAGAGTDVPVLAVSPALWPSWDEVAIDEAFDSEEQYDACMALVRTELVAATRVDCGTGDPFYRDIRSVLEETDVEQHYEPGAHAAAYWDRVLPDQLDWLAGRLSATGPQ